MSYSNPVRITYPWLALNFASGAGYRTIAPPPGANRGVVVDIHVSVTTLFTAVTTPAYVRIGTAAAAAKYAELNLGTGAANAAVNAVTNLASGLTPIISDIDLARDSVTTVRLTTVAPTGGTPAGVGDVLATIAWS